VRFRAPLHRVLVASLVVLCAFTLLASRLVYLQVVRHADLDERAEQPHGGGISCPTAG
jgi:penicillin-binding protein 2